MRRKRDRGRYYAAGGAALVALLVAGVGALTGWFGLGSVAGGGPCPKGVVLQGAGASFPLALVSVWGAGFAASTSDLVNYNPGGAGLGIQYLTERLVDFAITDEGLSPDESSQLAGSVGPVLTLPLVGGAVAITANVAGFAGPLKLSGQDLAAIYLGQVTSWDDPTLVAHNPGLAGVALPITPVHRADPAGMSFVLTDLLSRSNITWASTPGLGTSLSPAWPTTPREEGATGNAQMIEEVRKNNGAIGYTDLYDARSLGLAIAALLNPSGEFVVPTPASTQSAIDDVYAADPGSFPTPAGNWDSVDWVNAPGPTDYPLATLVYYLVAADAGRGASSSLTDAQVLVQWLRYTLTAGQGFDPGSYPFAHPPAPLLQDAGNAVAAMTFHGSTIPLCP